MVANSHMAIEHLICGQSELKCALRCAKICNGFQTLNIKNILNILLLYL